MTLGYHYHKILDTAQSPNSSLPFLFDFGLGLGTWTRACQFLSCLFGCWEKLNLMILSYILRKQMMEFLLTTAGCLLGFSHIATTPATEMKMNETRKTEK